MNSKWKLNCIPDVKLKEYKMILIGLRSLITYLENQIQKHMDYNKCNSDSEWRAMSNLDHIPYNSDVYNTCLMIRKQLLIIQKAFK